MDKTVEHTSRLSIIGGIGTTLASWGVSDWMAVAGVVIGAVGLCVNYWAVRRRDAREESEHIARMMELDNDHESGT